MVNLELFERLHAVVDAGRKMVDDKTASVAPELYDVLTGEGALVKAGTRINWNGVLKRAAVDMWDSAENSPDNAPTLWEDVAYKDGYRIIPETITSGLAFELNEYGWWKGVLYKSAIDANVWTPEQNPSGWEKVVE